VEYNIDLQSKAVLNIITQALDALNITYCAGRQQLFKDKNAIIFEFNNATQFQQMRPYLGECVFISPGKCLCAPSVDGRSLTQALTGPEELSTVKFRFRRSGPMGGKIFAAPKDVREHINARRAAIFVARQPEPERNLLGHQAIVQVLHYENINSPNMPGIIIDKIAEGNTNTNRVLSENLDPDAVLGAYEWKRLQHGGQWNGKILVQLTDIAELTWLHRRAHGRGFCSDGYRATLEISSPTRVSLAAELFSNLASQPGASAA